MYVRGNISVCLRRRSCWRCECGLGFGAAKQYLQLFCHTIIHFQHYHNFNNLDENALPPICLMNDMTGIWVVVLNLPEK